MLVVSFSIVHIVSENRNHGLVSIFIKMMYFIPLVQNICHHDWRRSIDNCRRNHIWHVSMIAVLWETKLWIGVELTNSGEMNVATKGSQQENFRIEVTMTETV